MTAFEQARTLLGPHAVLLPVKRGSKAVVVKGWQHTTLLDTMAGSYQAKMRKAPAVAVLLGPPSRDLIAIDFDQDWAAEEFLALNPAFAHTLRTRGARGCAFWIIMAEPYPAQVVPLTNASGAALGEWRGGNCYSLICGEHPDGHPYSILTQAPSIAISIESIRWPDEWNIPRVMQGDSPGVMRGDTDRLRPADSRIPGVFREPSQKRQGGPAGAIQKTASSIGYQGDGQNSLDAKQQNQVLKLYERFIEDCWTPAPGKRNEFIKKAVPFLFNAMSESAVMALVMRYYDVNRQLFKDSRETHRREALAHLRNVAARFPVSKLTQRECRIYEALPGEKRKAVLRFCRTLAKRPSVRSECEGGCFFLSYADIGARLLIDPKGARKLMQTLITAKVVEIVSKGLVWEKGHRPQATVWRYLL